MQLSLVTPVQRNNPTKNAEGQKVVDISDGTVESDIPEQTTRAIPRKGKLPLESPEVILLS